MAKKRLKTIPSTKLISSMSKHPLFGGESTHLTISICTHKGGPTYIAASLNSVYSPEGYCCIFSSDIPPADSPEEVLYNLGLNHISLSNSQHVSDSTGYVQCLALTYPNSLLRSFLEIASDLLESEGSLHLIPAVTLFLSRHDMPIPQPIKDATHIAWYPVHSHYNEDAESSGIVSYDELTELRQFSKTKHLESLCYAFSLHDPTTKLRLGMALCDGKRFAYVPDDDPICTSSIIIDRHILNSINGRGYSVLDLQVVGPKQSLQGILPTGEGFAIEWDLGLYQLTHIKTEDIMKEGPKEINTLLPNIRLGKILEVLRDPVINPNKLKIEDVHIANLAFQRPGEDAKCVYLIYTPGDNTQSTGTEIQAILEVGLSKGYLDLYSDQNLGSTYVKSGNEACKKFGVHRISAIPGHAIKPLIKSKLFKNENFTLYPCAVRDKSAWSISTSGCRFDSESASCLVMPFGDDRLDYFFGEELLERLSSLI